MRDSQLYDSISTIAPRKPAVPKIIPEGFKRRQGDQERRIEYIIAQTKLLSQENALLRTQLEDQCAHIQVLH